MYEDLLGLFPPNKFRFTQPILSVFYAAIE